MALGFAFIGLGAVLFWPVTLGYTFLAGERATAHVAECHRVVYGKRSDLVCTGAWRTADGDTGSGEIYALSRSDVGHEVSVRIGPMGPYAGGPLRSWPLFLPLLILLITVPAVIVLIRRATAPSRALGRRLLAEPPGDATLLVVTRTTATTPDGRPYASLRGAQAPPAYQPVRPPGRVRRGQRTAFEVVAGIGRNTSEFSTVHGSAGEPRYLIEHRDSREHQPETLLLDLSGTTRALIRRTSALPTTYAMLRPDGGRLGSIRPVPGTRVGPFAIKDEHGRDLAVVATDARRHVLRIASFAEPLVRDLALAFAFHLCRPHG